MGDRRKRDGVTKNNVRKNRVRHKKRKPISEKGKVRRTGRTSGKPRTRDGKNGRKRSRRVKRGTSPPSQGERLVFGVSLVGVGPVVVVCKGRRLNCQNEETRLPWGQRGGEIGRHINKNHKE